MRNLYLPISALCFFLSAVGVTNATEIDPCDLEARTNDLKNAKSELSIELQKLSTIKSCTLDFDNSVKTSNEIVTLETQLKKLVGRVSTLQQDLNSAVEQIQKSSGIYMGCSYELSEIKGRQTTKL